MARAERETGKQLAPSQREALERIIAAKVAVVTGGPGVGKTTLLATLLSILRSDEIKVVLTAPTGRAAKRMAEQTGLRPRPSIAFWKSIPTMAASNAGATGPSMAI